MKRLSVLFAVVLMLAVAGVVGAEPITTTVFPDGTEVSTGSIIQYTNPNNYIFCQAARYGATIENIDCSGTEIGYFISYATVTGKTTVTDTVRFYGTGERQYTHDVSILTTDCNGPFCASETTSQFSADGINWQVEQ